MGFNLRSKISKTVSYPISIVFSCSLSMHFLSTLTIHQHLFLNSKVHLTVKMEFNILFVFSAALKIHLIYCVIYGQGNRSEDGKKIADASIKS